MAGEEGLGRGHVREDEVGMKEGGVGGAGAGGGSNPNGNVCYCRAGAGRRRGSNLRY